jgi:hypothetical protein
MVSVLHVLLTILKILGIAILVILGIVLAVLILVLFVPVRYKAKGSFEGKNIDVGANVSWLFKLIHFRVGYKYSEPFHMKLKILGIPIYDNLKEKKPKKSKNKEKSKKEVEIDNVVINDEKDDKQKVENSENIGETEPKVLIEYDENKIEEGAKENIHENVHEKKTGIFSKIAGVFKNIKFTFEKICDTIKKIRDNIEYYIKLLNLESTKAAFELCKKQIFKLLKLLCPRKYHVNLHLGFDDPSTMGEVLAVYGMLYPWHMGKVEILPEYDVAVMEGNFYVKGRICIVSVIKAACIIYFDKNVKLFIKHLKRRNNINREE